MKNISFLFAFILFSGCSSSQDLNRLLESANDALGGGGTSGLSNGEVVNGLKEALEVGTKRAVAVSGKENGFWENTRLRIPFPEEAIKVKNTLVNIGLASQVENFELTLNRAAESAVKEAVPVFVDAITGMSIQDGFTILRGGDDAATRFLHDRTGTILADRFRPVVEKATSQVALTSYWTPLVNSYNTATILTGGSVVDPDLDAYVTNKAIDGLFLLLADEEKKIREDPIARTSEILQRVFGSL